MNTHVNLMIVSIDWQTGNFFVLSCLEDRLALPTKKVETFDKQPKDFAANLFQDHVDIDKNWAKIKMESARILGDDLHLTFSTVVPIESGLIKGRFVNTSEVDKDHTFITELNKATGTIQ